MINIPGSKWNVKIPIMNIKSHPSEAIGQICNKRWWHRRLATLQIKVEIGWWLISWQLCNQVCDGTLVFQTALSDVRVMHLVMVASWRAA